MYHGQNLVTSHFVDDLVGVADGQVARDGGDAVHAVATGIIDHDEVGAAFFLQARDQSCTGGAGDDGLAPVDFFMKLLKNLLFFLHD